MVQNSIQFSKTNATGIKRDAGMKQTDALYSFRKNLSTHAEQAQCAVGLAEPITRSGKVLILNFECRSTGWANTQPLGQFV